MHGSTDDLTQYARDRSLDIDYYCIHHSDTMYYGPTIISREYCLQSCVAWESARWTFFLSATVHGKVELSLIWAQVALCKLTTGADLTVVARCLQFRYTANTKVDGCSFMAGMAQFSPFLHDIEHQFLCTDGTLNYSRINSTAHRAGFAQIRSCLRTDLEAVDRTPDNMYISSGQGGFSVT